MDELNQKESLNDTRGKIKSFIVSLFYTTIVLAIYTLPFISPLNINKGLDKLFEAEEIISGFVGFVVPNIILYLFYLGLVFVVGYFICLKLLNTPKEELVFKKPLKIIGALALIHIILFFLVIIASYLYLLIEIKEVLLGLLFITIYASVFFLGLLAIFTAITLLSYLLIRFFDYRKLVLFLVVASIAIFSVSFFIYRSNHYCYPRDYVCNTEFLVKENKISQCESADSNHDTCYSYFAEGGKDVSICQELVSQNAKSQCISIFAKYSKSPKNCGLIDSDYTYRYAHRYVDGHIYKSGVSYQEMCCIGYYNPLGLGFDESSSFNIASNNYDEGIDNLTPEQLTSCDIKQ